MNNLCDAGIVRSPAVRRAMLLTDRRHFVPELPEAKRKSSRYNYGPYADGPQALGFKVWQSLSMRVCARVCVF